MAKAELVFIPLPDVGHISSKLEITKLLLQHDERIAITVLVIKCSSDPKQFAFDKSLGNPALSKQIRFVDLQYNDKLSVPDSHAVLPSLVEKDVKEVVTKLFRSESNPDSPKLGGFVIDAFRTSMIEVANDLGVPSYVYFTSGASILSLMLHLQSIYDEKGFDVSKVDTDTKLNIPGFVNPVPIEVLPRSVLNEDTTATHIEIFRKCRGTKGILINSFKDLEPNSIATLIDDKNSPVFYHVGPSLNLQSHGQDNADKYSEIMKWLDHQPPTSVVFLCFGSLGAFGEAQIKEIAYALERSGHRFLWSLRQPPQKDMVGRFPGEYEHPEEVLPKGFLNRTAGNGKIVGWAPQAAILAHPAVGGFVSHCGWNSILESIWFGVPIAAWPIYAEQQVNAFAMVKELGLAVDIKMNYWKNPENEIIVSRDGSRNFVEGRQDYNYYNEYQNN